MASLLKKLSAAFLFSAALFSAEAAGTSVRFSTYLGGSDMDVPSAVASGPDGSVYVTGIGGSSDIPNVTLDAGGGAFIVKTSPDGSSVTYNARIPGIFPRAIAVDPQGQVYVAGYRYYGGFPSTNAFQAEPKSDWDAALVKINAAGTQILFATYLGGSADDGALAIALDSANRIWVAGLTSSTDFPAAGTPFQAARAGTIDAFLARFSTDGALEYSTYFGGAEGATIAYGLAVGADDGPILCGWAVSTAFPTGAGGMTPVATGGSDAFVAKFNATGSSLVSSKLLGGSGEDSALAVAVDAAGNTYVRGSTRSDDLPTVAAFQPALGGEEDIFLTKLRPDGSTVYSTYLGSGLTDGFFGWPNSFGSEGLTLQVGGLAVTPAGRAFVAGSTYGSNFPQANGIKTPNEQYNLDAVGTIFEPDGTVAFSTFVGGKAADLGVAATATPDGGFVLAGYTGRAVTQPDFPATPGALRLSNANDNIDGFLVKFDDAAPLLVNDNFANALTLDGASPSILVQTDAATLEAGEPAAAGAGKSVWFKWTAPSSGRAIISTELSTFPTILAIYHGTSLATLVSATPAGVDHETFSEARLPVAVGEAIYIQVAGRDGATGTLDLSLVLSLPPNDDFETRLPIVGPTATVTGSNISATSERFESVPHTVWWKFAPTQTGYYTLTTVGSDFNTGLIIYTGAPPSLTLLDYASAYTNQLARSTFLAEAGAEYQIVVFGDNGETGQIQLNIAPAVRPPNDDFAQRTRLTGRNELVTASDFDAGLDPAELRMQQLLGVGAASGRMLWWEWVAPIDGAAEITTTNSYAITDPTIQIGTSILIFEGDATPTAENVKFVVQASADGTRPAATYLTDIRAGTHYQIGVDAVSWQQPVAFSLRIRAIAPPKIVVGTSRIQAGIFRASVEGIDGRNYRVKSSPDLKTWNLVSEHPAITGRFDFESPVSGAQQFYRIEEF